MGDLLFCQSVSGPSLKKREPIRLEPYLIFAFCQMYSPAFSFFIAAAPTMPRRSAMLRTPALSGTPVCWSRPRLMHLQGDRFPGGRRWYPPGQNEGMENGATVHIFMVAQQFGLGGYSFVLSSPFFINPLHTIWLATKRMNCCCQRLAVS